MSPDRGEGEGARSAESLAYRTQVCCNSSMLETSTYRSAMGVCIEPGHPNGSRMVDLVSRRSRFRQMPPLASDVVDAAAVALLRRWIEAM